MRAARQCGGGGFDQSAYIAMSDLEHVPFGSNQLLSVKIRAAFGDAGEVCQTPPKGFDNPYRSKPIDECKSSSIELHAYVVRIRNLLEIPI
jgi:hypothetical protein